MVQHKNQWTIIIYHTHTMRGKKKITWSPHHMPKKDKSQHTSKLDIKVTYLNRVMFMHMEN